jgi:hypothetical protein
MSRVALWSNRRKEVTHALHDPWFDLEMSWLRLSWSTSAEAPL